MHSPGIIEAAEVIHSAQTILFITGAGVSADSGLPTYRGVGGLYDDQHTEDGVAIETALSGSMFATRPELTWKYLWQIGSACVGAQPNAAHRFISDLEKVKSTVWVVTQNVDGLHRAAGSRNLVEVHGHAFDLYCIDCSTRFTAHELLGDYQHEPRLPRCIQCQGIIRPDVVLFEEMLSDNVLQLLEQLGEASFDAVLAVGTSALFPYIAYPFVRASQSGAAAIEINPADTTVSEFATIRIRQGAAAACRQIEQQLKQLEA